MLHRHSLTDSLTDSFTDIKKKTRCNLAYCIPALLSRPCPHSLALFPSHRPASIGTWALALPLTLFLSSLFLFFLFLCSKENQRACSLPFTDPSSTLLTTFLSCSIGAISIFTFLVFSSFSPFAPSYAVLAPCANLTSTRVKLAISRMDMDQTNRPETLDVVDPASASLKKKGNCG